MNINELDPHTGRMVDENGDARNVIDAVTGGAKNINTDHAANHEGIGYRTFMESTNLASGASVSWCFTGPSTLFAHIKNLLLSVLKSSGKLELIYDAAVTANIGDAVNIVNTNHNSVAVPQSTLKTNPTYTGGTTWDMAEALADSTNQSVGTASIALNPNEESITQNAQQQYIIKLTNIGANTMERAFIKFFFYEEEKGIG